MSMVELAVRRPVTTTMMTLVLVLLGGVSLSRLSVDLMPELSFPTVTVVTVYRGAGPEEVETLVTRPIEQVLSAVTGVDEVSSESKEGSSEIRVQFRWGTNIDQGIADIRQQIDKVRQRLPEDIETPYIRKYNTADSPIIYLGLETELSPTEATTLAETMILPRLEQIDGVARVSLRGHVRREIQIDLDRNKLASLSMGINDVLTALQAGNENRPAGDLAEGDLNLLVRTRGDFTSLEQIRETAIRQNEDAIVRISDVGVVVDGVARRTDKTRVNGQPGVMIYVFKQAGANTVHVSDRVQAKLAQLNEELLQAQLTLRLDKSRFIRQSISNIQQSAAIGMGLAILILILFLYSFRSAMVIGVAMPVSVVATFAMIYLNGFTLNMVSFGGLALGIGLLVDNSIVVLESIYRKRDDGLSARQAAIEGTNEVSGAILASTMTTLIVFVPLIFIEGITGVLLHQLAWVVSFSLLCSLVISLTLTPVMAAYWLGETEGQQRHWLLKPVDWFHGVNRFVFGSIENVYAFVLRQMQRAPLAVGGLTMLLIASVGGLFPLIGTEFFPKTDEGVLSLTMTMAPGIQLETLDDKASVVEQRILNNTPELTTLACFLGGDEDDADRWNRGHFRIRLTTRSERKPSDEDIRQRLDALMDGIPGSKISLRTSQEHMLFRRLANGSGQFMVNIRGHDSETAELLAQMVIEELEQVEGLVNVEIVQADRRPELSTFIDRSKASLFGISVSEITRTMETAIRGTEATLYRENGQEYPVLVRLREEDRRARKDLAEVGISTPSGEIIPLRSLLDVSNAQAPVMINRQNQQRVSVISADVEERDLGQIVAEVQQRFRELPVPKDFQLEIDGDYKEQQQSFQMLMIGFVLALTLMYMVMASQFESFTDPILIMVSVPLALVGVILVLVLSGTTLNVQSFIGLIVLAGIVVNNAIVVVDYINQLRQTHPETPLKQLVYQASVRRFRPVLMTTLTTVLAMLPIAFGMGDGGELQAPMARVVIGGLLSGTFITLIVIPLLYQETARQKTPVTSSDAAANPQPPIPLPTAEVTA